MCSQSHPRGIPKVSQPARSDPRGLHVVLGVFVSEECLALQVVEVARVVNLVGAHEEHFGVERRVAVESSLVERFGVGGVEVVQVLNAVGPLVAEVVLKGVAEGVAVARGAEGVGRGGLRLWSRGLWWRRS